VILFPMDFVKKVNAIKILIVGNVSLRKIVFGSNLLNYVWNRMALRLTFWIGIDLFFAKTLHYYQPNEFV